MSVVKYYGKNLGLTKLYTFLCRYISQYSSSIRALNVSNKGSLQVKSYLLQIINLMLKLNTALITIDHFYS